MDTADKSTDRNGCSESMEKEYLMEIARLQSELLKQRAESGSIVSSVPTAPKYSPQSPRYAQGDEIVRLNVGGQLFTTLRSTLCSVPGSMLEAMFSGRFGIPAMRDDSGAYFLDRDPIYFEFILSYLRDPRNRPSAKSNQSRLGILREFEYFGLLPDAGVYVAEPGCNIICTHHLELASRFSSMTVYGSRAYVSTETHIELWCLDAQECKKRKKLPPGALVRSLEATATKCFVLCGESEIQVWDADLEAIIKRIEPNTGWISHFQLVPDLYDLVPSSSASSQLHSSSIQDIALNYDEDVSYSDHRGTGEANKKFSSFNGASEPNASNSFEGSGINHNESKNYFAANERRRTHYPLWCFNGTSTSSQSHTSSSSSSSHTMASNSACYSSSFASGGRPARKRSLLFFDGDSGIHALDLDSLSISTVIEVKEQEVPMAFHVSGEELYFATEGNLNSFNLRTYQKALLSSTAIEFKRIRAIENELLVCWDTMGDRLIHFDLRTRNWTSATPSDRWHPLTEQCEVFRSLVVGRDFANRIVLWCTSPLICDENSAGSFSSQTHANSTTNTNFQHSHGNTQLGFATASHGTINQAAGAKGISTRVISLFNEAPSASSYFFQFQGSSIVVATTSPNESRTNAAGIAGLVQQGGAGDNLANHSEHKASMPSGSIRVFSIRR